MRNMKEKKADKKALSLAMKPNTAPILAIAPQLAQKSDANTTSLDNSRYGKLCEKLKATQLHLEAEKAKGERAATTSRLEMESLRKASESTIKELELSNETAYKETREIDEKLIEETADNLATKAALLRSKQKISK
ncbi:uncharacterized protein RAG0_15198 [Rhynchosporium agropyri]|uniref:Uncharacterized protein n=1 Tax=Rhynchosporium agropyri TaxID=914238 RepID=A0A1E1LK31_9HELO|nr:uncharacterized protein RAG0_15198 [Rhynchosporium agropyri]